MADVLGTMFFLQFIVAIGIILVTTYNVMTLGSLYKVAISFLLWVLYLICIGVGFVVFMSEPETMLFSMLWKFEAWFITLQTIYLFIQVFYHLREKAIFPDQMYKPERALGEKSEK